MDGRQFANIFSNLPLYCMLTCLCYLLHIFDESTYKFIFGGLVRSKHFFSRRSKHSYIGVQLLCLSEFLAAVCAYSLCMEMLCCIPICLY
jgi:hypothetical protein